MMLIGTEKAAGAADSLDQQPIGVSTDQNGAQPSALGLELNKMVEKEANLAEIHDSKAFACEQHVLETGSTEMDLEMYRDGISGPLGSVLKDDPTLRTVTVRSCIIGVIMGIVGASVAQLFVFKPIALHVPALFVQLVCFLMGLACSKIPGPEWWNPGPFSSKETAFAAIMAVSASIDAIAVQMLSAQDLYFNHRYPVIVSLSVMMSSQLIGYGWAGLLKSLLIYPANTSYPSMLPSVTLIRSLAGRDELSRAQLNFFKKAIIIISVYEVFPSYIAPALQAISPWCLTLPREPIVTQLFGGSQITEGLGLFAFSFDWATLSHFGPLYTPFGTQLTQWCAVLFSIFLYMGAYRYNWFNGGQERGFPFLSATLLNDTGGVYNLTMAIYANASSALSTALLYKWRDMKSVLIPKGSPASREDPHRTITKNYREFPLWGTLSVLIISSIVALVVSHYSESGLSIWGMLCALILSGIVSIGAGFLFATTGVVLGIMTPIQLVGGLMFRGNALANFWFNTFASTSTYQCLNILKGGSITIILEKERGTPLIYFMLSHINQPATRDKTVSLHFHYRIFASEFDKRPICFNIGDSICSYLLIFGTFVNYFVMAGIVNNQRDVLLLPNGNGILTGIHILGYQSQAIAWGVFAKDLYAPGKIYSVVVYCALAGLVAPIPLYLLHKWRPSIGLDKVNLSIFFSAVPGLTGTLSSGQMIAIALGFWSQFYMRRYRTNCNILNAALLGGTEFTILILLVFFQGGAGWSLKMPRYFLNPVGPPDYCQVKQ